MTDIVDPATRSRMMSGIRGKNTQPELRLRRLLHAEGFRFLLHDRRLPGKPDIVLPKWKAVIQVQGCFWHQHEGCRFARTPATRQEFWEEKLAGNVERDRRNMELLQDAGWRTATVWECSLQKQNTDALVERLAAWIRSNSAEFEPD